MLAAVLLVGGACSGGDGITVGQEPTPTTVGPESSPVPETPSEDTTPAEGPAEGEPAEGDPAVDAGPPLTLDPATPGAQPAVAEAGGWRLVVTFPSTGSTVGRSAGLCYQVTGPSREADVVLELTVGNRAPIRVAGSVGRGSADVELGEADPEPLDFRIQLIVNGQRLSGVTAAIPGVLIVPAANRPNCA